MTRQIVLEVNGVPIPLDYFTQTFLDHTIGGMLEALEETTTIKTLALFVNDGQLSVVLNSNKVRTNEFVTRIIIGTITGMISSLKGVTDISKIHISLSR